MCKADIQIVLLEWMCDVIVRHDWIYFYCALDVGIILMLTIRKYCVGLKSPENTWCWSKITLIVKSPVKLVWKEMMKVVLCLKALCHLTAGCIPASPITHFIHLLPMCSLPVFLTGVFCDHSCWVTSVLLCYLTQWDVNWQNLLYKELDIFRRKWFAIYV